MDSDVEFLKASRINDRQLNPISVNNNINNKINDKNNNGIIDFTKKPIGKFTGSK